MNNKQGDFLLIRCVLSSVSVGIPLIMLNAPMWVISLVSLALFLPCIVPYVLNIDSALVVTGLINLVYNILLRPGLYTAGLIVTIQGEQDLIAIVFYILAGVQSFNIMKWFFVYVVQSVSYFKK